MRSKEQDKIGRLEVFMRYLVAIAGEIHTMDIGQFFVDKALAECRCPRWPLCGLDQAPNLFDDTQTPTLSINKDQRLGSRVYPLQDLISDIPIYSRRRWRWTNHRLYLKIRRRHRHLDHIIRNLQINRSLMDHSLLNDPIDLVRRSRHTRQNSLRGSNMRMHRRKPSILSIQECMMDRSPRALRISRR
ncbi:hypothetical protein HG530_006936 [Fusarium avenaceum]|nr:hypothetical protein HG530_006936 [Fusarium avenaceum]